MFILILITNSNC